MDPDFRYHNKGSNGEIEENMQIGRIVDIFLAIVTVAGAMVVVTSKYTAGIISAFGSAFTGGLKAATGK